MRGPVPKHSSERVGHARGKAEDVAITRGEARDVKWPAASKEWSARAKELYKSARASGQADFYQQSDVAQLRFLLDQVTYYEAQPQRSAMMLQVIMATLNSLLFTEGERRRVRVELDKVDTSAVDAQVVAIKSYKDKLAGGPAKK